MGWTAPLRRGGLNHCIQRNKKDRDRGRERERERVEIHPTNTLNTPCQVLFQTLTHTHNPLVSHKLPSTPSVTPFRGERGERKRG